MRKGTHLFLVSAFAVLVSGIANASLVTHYEFEGNADDSAGSADGTLMDDATYGVGPTYGGKNFGQALSLDGDGDYMDCGATFASVTASTTKTITAWAKSDTADYSGQAAGNGRIITLHRESGYSGFSMLANGSPSTWQGLYAIAGNLYNYIDSGLSVTANEWAHIALVQDGAGVYIYINGVLANSSTDAAAPTMRRLVNADIGSYWGGYSSFFDGFIDDVRIYDHALSQSEIQAVIPEPATLLLLGLGGLALLRKRRFR